MKQINDFQNSTNKKGQDFTGANIENQNNFYSSTIFKPLSTDINVKVYENLFNRKSLIDFAFISFITSIFLIVIGVNWVNIELDLTKYFIVIIECFLILYTIFLIMMYIYRYLNLSKLKLVIKEHKIFFDNKDLEFKDIRSFMKIKDQIGYSIYIYKSKEIFPYIEFSVDSIHLANSIEELVIYNIKNQRGREDGNNCKNI